MITLYTFPAAFGLRNVSPFCLKVEMALHWLGLDYQIEEMSDPRKAPKGKLPFIDVNGEKIADSEIILEYLDRSNDGKLFGNLSDDQIARGTAYTRLAEDHLYWIMVASRWLDDEWWPNVVEGFFGSMPFPLKQLVKTVARSQVRKTYDLQGLGKHSLQEQKDFASRDLDALNRAVKGSRFLLGEELTVFDFAVAALISGAVDNKPDTWLTPMIREFPELCDYAERVQQEVGVFAR